MGVEARWRPCHSTAHCWHMKRKPSLHHCCPCRGRQHCNRRRNPRCHCRLHRHCCCRRPLPSLSAIAVAVAVDHCRHHLCCVAVNHCHCRCLCPCYWPLPSLSPSAIAVAISICHHRQIPIGHFRAMLPWRSENCILPGEAKNAYLILFCSDSGRHTDQSRMTDQVLSGNGQHQHWVASGKH
jgi:hypothetical protein